LIVGVDAINAAQELFLAFFAIYFALNIDRSQREYHPYDTYSVWKGSRHAFRLLIAAWVVTFILPLVQFAITFSLLDGVALDLNLSFTDTLIIVAIGFLSFFQFGYYRIFEAIISLRPEAFFPEEDRKIHLHEERREFRSHFIPGVLYVVASIAVLTLILIL
jgi:hypothetical protein